MKRFFLFLVLVGFLGLGPGAGPAVDPPKPGGETPAPAGKEEDEDIQLLKKAGIGTDDASLLAYLKQFEKVQADYAEVEKRLADLDSEDFFVREKASKWFVELGPRGLQCLAWPRHWPRTEAGARAKACAEKIEKEPKWKLGEAAARVVLARKPRGMVGSLLAYLPFASDCAMEEDLWRAVDREAGKKSFPLSLLIPFLKDPVSDRRALAGFTLARHGGEDGKKAVLPLLGDKAAMVRLRTAQGFLAVHDTAGISTLIDLLEHHLVEISWQAEELLHWAAGEGAPKETVGLSDDAGRKKCRQAWRNWFQKTPGKVVFPQPGPNQRRPLLLVIPGDFLNPDSISRRDGSCIWGCGGYQPRYIFPPGNQLVHVLPLNRFLSYYQTNNPEEYHYHYKEISLGSKKVWYYVQSGYPIPLANGNVFFENKYLEELEIRPDGNPLVKRIEGEPRSILKLLGGLKKRSDGNIVGLWPLEPISWERPVSAQMVVWNGKTLKEMKRVLLPHKLRSGAGVWGNNLVYCADKGIYEVSDEGKLIWDYSLKVSQKVRIFPDRLRNGNTLISGKFLAPYSYNEEGWIGEIGPKGKLFREWFIPFIPFYFEICFPLVQLGFDDSFVEKEDLGESMGYFLKGLGSSDLKTRRRFVVKAFNFPNLKKLTPALWKLRSDPDPFVKIRVWDSLIKADARELTIPALIDSLGDPDPDIQERIHLCFEKHKKTALPYLTKALEDKREKIRGDALELYCEFNDYNHAIVWPLLMKSEKDKSEIVREKTFRTMLGHLIHLQKRKKEDQLKKEDCLKLKALILKELGNPNSKMSILQMFDILKKYPFPFFDHKVVQPLIKVLKEKNGFYGAAYILGEMGPIAEEAIPILNGFLKDKDPYKRETAFLTIGKIMGRKK